MANGARHQVHRGAALFLAAFAAACSASPGATVSDARDARDLPPETTLPDGAARCHLPLGTAQPFGGCQARFDDASWKDGVCFFPSAEVTEQACVGHRSRTFNLATHAWTCYYDPTTLTLVAGRFNDDVTSFCDRGSSEITIGDIPEPGACQTPTSIVMPCVDGGSD